MDAVIAVFAHHQAADVAVRRLVVAGCDKSNLSVVGRGCHAAEDAVAIASGGERIRFWGPRGEFWGGLWGLFFGGLFLTFPGMGIVIVLGYLAATTMSAVEDETIADGFCVLRLLAGLGVPSDAAVRYEAAVRADGFLVMAHGSPEEVAHSEKVLAAARPLVLEAHSALLEPASRATSAMATVAECNRASKRLGWRNAPAGLGSSVRA